VGSINLIAMRELQQLGESVIWLVIVGALSLGLAIVALVGLGAIARELILEHTHEADSTEKEGTPGTGDVGRASRRRCVLTE
jgi:hypothetical protein